MTIGLIGTGHIGAALVENLARKGEDIIVTKRSEAISRALSEKYPQIRVGENDAVMEADTIIIALRPDVAIDIVKSLNFRANQRVISVMARVSRSELLAACSPVSEIAITLPLENVAGGGCPLPSFGDTHIVSELFGHNNEIIPLTEEAHLNAFFAASTTLTTLMNAMALSRDWLGDEIGNTQAAETYITMLSAGYLQDIPTGGQGDLEKWRMRLAADGTLNRRMLDALQNAPENGQIDALNEIKALFK